MKLELHEIFFDVLSGVATAILALGVTCVLSEQVAHKAIAWVLDVTAPKLALIGFASYLIGVVVDGIGFAVDSVLLDRLPFVKKYEGDPRRAFFLARAPEHVFAYRNHQWKYFICYRNLFLLLIPGVPVAWILASRAYGAGKGAIVGSLLLVLLALLGWTAVSVVKFYFSLEQRFFSGCDGTPWNSSRWRRASTTDTGDV